MPPEIVFIIIISVAAGTFLVTYTVKQVLDYLNGKRSSPSANEGPSLTTSELEAMMRRAVDQATAPLKEKVEHLEALLDTPPPLNEGHGPDLILDADAETDPEPVRRRPRQRS